MPMTRRTPIRTAEPPAGLEWPQPPWSMSGADLLAHLASDPEHGLEDAEAAARLRRYGRNQLRTRAARHVLAILTDQFRSAVVLLLVAAAAAAFAFGERLESGAILVVIALNTAIGFLTEWRATRSMEALRRLGRVETLVRRGGVNRTIAAEELVPGDVVPVEAGDVLSADLRLLEAAKLAADESTLTGESTAVAKQASAIAAGAILMERTNLLFKGTVVTRGSGLGLVIGTGAHTELGRVSTLVERAEAHETPLERKLDALGRRLVVLVLVLAALLVVAGLAAGRGLVLAVEVAIALAVAAIPEGLPVVATLALARGMWRMARRNALIVRLSAVETLGATGVILSDKTGTLTENRMTVTHLVVDGRQVDIGGTGLETTGAFTVAGAAADDALLGRVDELLTAAVLCNNAFLEPASGDGRHAVGDPGEVALLVAAAKRGIDARRLRHRFPELREEPFDPETRAMATFNEADGRVRVSVKGAPEAILPRCKAIRSAPGDMPLGDGDRRALLRRADELGRNGLRLLAVAVREVDDPGAEPYRDLVFLGLLALYDPPRSGVKEAIARCGDAGVRVVMVTGDHAGTARRIAAGLGLLPDEPPDGAVVLAADLFHDGAVRDPDAALAARVIARAAPAQKLALIDLYQQNGHVVAMTGDGVNDAPALKHADIGVAMGVRGTPVAKEAAAMVLQDDEFATIVEAIRLGRAIYANIRKFVVYLFSCNTSEILVVTLATLAGAPLPLLPLQILFLNLVTDVFPALALGVGPGAPGLMERAPRPANEPLLARRHWWRIGSFGVLIAVTVLAAMALAHYVLALDPARTLTVSFGTLALAQLWHVFNMRESDASRAGLRNEITANGWVWGALALCLVLILAAVYLPALSGVLQLADPGWRGWSLILAMSLAPLLAGPLVQAATRPGRL
jgi:Ca2+-transporting ATPase